MSKYWLSFLTNIVTGVIFLFFVCVFKNVSVKYEGVFQLVS